MGPDGQVRRQERGRGDGRPVAQGRSHEGPSLVALQRLAGNAACTGLVTRLAGSGLGGRGALLRSGGNAANTRLLGPRGASTSPLPVQRIALETFGGKFETVQYEAVSGALSKGEQAVGAVADLAFTPNKLIEGKVGLIQTGNAQRDAVTDIGKDADKANRAQKAGDLDRGRFLDRSARKENPIFGMENQSRQMGKLEDASGLSMEGQQNTLARNDAAATVAKGDSGAAVDPAAVSSSAGTVGSRTAAPELVVPAKLRDEPARTRRWDPGAGSGEGISMRFETAALGLSGKIEGAYLGSVEWGFQAKPDAEKAAVIPFSRVSMGVPSAAYMRSAELWNADKTTGTATDRRMTLPMAVTTHRSDPALDAMLADRATPMDQLRAAIEARITLLESEIPSDAEVKIAALRAKATEDSGKADKVQAVLDDLQREYAAAKARTKLADADKKTADQELAAAIALSDATNKRLNAITRLVSGDLKQQKADVVAKEKSAADAKGRAARTGAAERASGQATVAARNDPANVDKFSSYRDSLLALQNLVSDARSRSFEIMALRAKLHA
jgi:hypothetical protein